MGVAQELCSFALGGCNVRLVSLPGPVARGNARNVHTCVVAKPQDILQRHHHQGSVACQRVAHQLCRHLNTARLVAARKGARAPTGERRRVVCRGVQNLARSALDAETQQTYDEILAACLQYKESVSLTTTNENLLAPAYQAITSDHGELFWVSGYNYTLKTKGDQVTEITFSPKYMFSKEDKELYQGYVDQTVDEYFAKLPDGASDYEKSKYVYEMLVYNVKYNLSAKENQNILSVFLFGESVCNGIASAAQYMLSLLDLPSMIVYGASENEPHAWNLVYLDGAPYFFDATWGITSSETVGDCSYAFLNITSRDIEKTHSIDMYINVPECTEVSDNYYVKEGHFFTTFNEASIGDILADSYANGKPGDIKCATDEVYAQVKQEFVDNQKLADYCRGISSINYVEREEMRTITFMWK